MYDCVHDISVSQFTTSHRSRNDDIQSVVMKIGITDRASFAPLVVIRFRTHYKNVNYDTIFHNEKKTRLIRYFFLFYRPDN